MLNIKNFLLVILVAVFLNGCSSVQKLDIFKTEVKREPLALTLPEPLKVEELKWYIVNSDNAEEVLDKIKKGGDDPVVFGLTDEGYESLTKNFAQIRAYIIKQRETIKKYQDYYEKDEQLPKE